MIKINKDFSAIPDSLKLPFEEYFPNGVTSPPRTTHLRRMEVINNRKYTDLDVFNSRYKQEDVKVALKNIYNNKCAFCEQRVEQSQIEHYRPKKVYYWLVFSWDNLIVACAFCNQYKGVNFDLSGTPCEFANTDANILKIHNSSFDYDRIERPKMVNPEVTDPLGKIEFEKNGIISSRDISFAYTIETCKIDRIYLNDERRKLLNIFKRDIRSALIENESVIDQQIEISATIRKFIRDSKDLELPFLAFRRYAISSEWLNEIIKEMN